MTLFISSFLLVFLAFSWVCFIFLGFASVSLVFSSVFLGFLHFSWVCFSFLGFASVFLGFLHFSWVCFIFLGFASVFLGFLHFSWVCLPWYENFSEFYFFFIQSKFCPISSSFSYLFYLRNWLWKIRFGMSQLLLNVISAVSYAGNMGTMKNSPKDIIRSRRFLYDCSLVSICLAGLCVHEFFYGFLVRLHAKTRFCFALRTWFYTWNHFYYNFSCLTSFTGKRRCTTSSNPSPKMDARFYWRPVRRGITQ